MEYTLDYLVNPEIFQINRMDAHSDHKYYASLEESKNKLTKLKKSLNGIWKFSYGKNPDLRIKDFFKENFNSNHWDNIRVPGHIQLQGYGTPHYVNTMYPWDGHEKLIPPEIPKDFNPVGSYIKKFTVPKEWDKNAVYISFQGVESAFYLWINGNFVGYSEDSFTPSEFDISKYLKEGENTLAVEVYKWCSGSWLEDQDFWRFSGIFRDVYLYSIPKVHIEDLFIKTEIENLNTVENRVALVDIDLKLKYQENRKIKLNCKCYDNKNFLISESKKNFIEKGKCTLSFKIEKPLLWSAEKPNLYEVEILVIDEKTDEIIEVVIQKIGIRKFELIDKIMYINGKRIVFKGVNRHEFSCYNGRVISEEEMVWDIKFLKANNFNAVRTSHYPNVTRWYELCDEYGLYIIDEANIETHGTWQKMGICKPDNPVPESRPEWREIVLDRGKSMFERDKNHSSILIWSCGNEAYGGKNLYEMSQYFRKVDPSRLVHYEGIFWDRRYNDTSDMESRMYAKVFEIEEYLNDNPQKPFILCEYSHAMGNSNGGLHKYVELEEKYPLYQGGFIWDYIDQSIMWKNSKGEQFLAFGGDFDDRPTDYNFCVNGLVYGDRKPSPKVQEVKYLFSNFEVKPQKNSVYIKNKSLFTNLNEYDVTWKLFKDGIQIENGKLDIYLEPLSAKEFPINLTEKTEYGEYIIEISISLKNNEFWAEKNYEIAFGQFVYKIEKKVEREIHNKPKLHIADCDVNYGVKGEGFHIIFSKSYGSIISLKYLNKEFIKSPIMPNFWRAITDNDRGNKMAFRYSQWKIASLYAKHSEIEIKNFENEAIIKYIYELPTLPLTKCEVEYRVFGCGTIEVNLSYPGYDNISEIPVFGVSFKIPGEYKRIEWYGNGPEESYVDRKHGAKLGIYKSEVKKQMSQYVIPQECGNKTDTRWIKITNDKEEGLLIKADWKENFEFSALPYTVHEIENAYHHYDLPNSDYTVLNINKIQMGVGGDDSWGAKTHDEYLIPSKKPLMFRFKIKNIILAKK